VKQNEIVARIVKGGCFFYGDYRAAKAETITYRDKLTGKTASFSTISHRVESGDDAISVQERVPDGADLTAFKPLYKKGQSVLVHCQTLEKVGGFLRATGSIEPVEGVA